MKGIGSQTRHKIIEESLQIFSVKGYFNTSINDILAATNLTKGGFYGHFASKEELWEASYERAIEIWRGIVFEGIRDVSDPVERISKTIENDLKNYIGSDVFAGGCFFFNMLIELTGQSERMSRRIRRGFAEFALLLESWLEEADRRGMLRPGVNCREVADFILIAINGATALYAASREKRVLDETVRQLSVYLGHLRA